MLTVSAAMMWFIGIFETELRTLFTGG